MTLGDRIAILNEGRIQQIGTPMELYDRPANQFVAGFLGTPSINLFPMEVAQGQYRVAGMPVDPSLLPQGKWNLTDGRYTLGVRPETMTTDPAGQGFAMDAEVALVENLGAETLVYFFLDGRQHCCRMPQSIYLEVGSKILLHMDLSQCAVFDETGANVGL